MNLRAKNSFISAVLTVTIAFTAMAVPYYGAESTDKTVVIFHTNDMHGSLQGSGSAIGVDKVAAIKKQYDNAILADAGDAAQGVALASLSKGEDIIDLMNTAGYDVMAAGNHEFDYGLNQLRKFVGMADFPIISANTYYEGRPFFENGDSDGCSTIIEKNGVKVGFFALTTTDTLTSTKPDGIAGIEFKNELETAKEQVQSLDEKGADVIIAITHMGIVEEEADITSYELAEAMADTELDAVIDGHSHSVVNEKIGNIVVAQTGTGLTALGKMEITVDEEGNADITETILSAEDMKNTEPDTATAEKLKSISEKQEAMLSKEIGKTENTLWGGSINQIAESRVGETNFGSLIADAIVRSVKELLPEKYKDMPVVSIENGGGFRAAVPNGTITMRNIVDALPYANTVMYKVVTPSVLYTVLEDFVSSVNSQNKDTGFMDAAYSGSFPQIGGMRFEYNPNGENGNKIEAVYIDSQSEALNRNDTDTKIILGSNDYVIGQSALKDIPLEGEGSGLTQSVVDYIAELTENGTKTLSLPVTYGRIKTVGEYAPKDYIANVRVKKADGSAAGEGKTSLYIDGVKTEGTIDNDGVLSFTVTDGPHSVKLYEDQAEVYVNNYSGAGVIESYGAWNAGFPVLTLSDTAYEESTETTSETTEITSQDTTETTSDTTEATSQAVTETAAKTTAAESTETTTSAQSGSRGGRIRRIPTVTTEAETEETTEEAKKEIIDKEVRVSVGSSRVTIGDDTYEMDAKPYIQAESSSLLVPVRFVSLAILGRDVDNADASKVIAWNPLTKTAYVTAKGDVIEFTAGSNTMVINGKSSVMDNGVKAEINNGRMYIPFRALGKALGVEVSWVGKTKTAVYSAK